MLEEEHKTRFYASHASAVVYQFMVPTCLGLKNDKEAFEYAERSKSKVFLYLLGASNIRPSVSVVTSELKSLLNDEEKYLFKLREVQSRHSRSMTGFTVNVRADNNAATVSPSANTRGGETADLILSELNKIYNKMERIDPEYVFVRRGRHLPLDKIQNILSQKENSHDSATILVEYFTTEDKVFMSCLTGFYRLSIKVGRLAMICRLVVPFPSNL